jgi:Flp pilus assembly protein TadD
MRPQSRQWLGATMTAVLLLGGCASKDGKTSEQRQQTELAKSMVDAADSALAQKDASTAAGYYRSALAREPDNVAAAIGLMQSLRLIGALDEARGVAERALAAHADDAAVAAEAGKIKLATGQLDEAIKLLKRAVAADATDWRARSDLGLAYDRVAEYQKADQSYREALAISPDNAAVLNNYALSRVMANDLKGAQTLLQDAASSPGADMRVRQNLALVYALSGDMGKAEELARRDLPPALVSEQLEYYRHLAATARLPASGGATPLPSLKLPDSSAADVFVMAAASAAQQQPPAPTAEPRLAVAASTLLDSAAAAPAAAAGETEASKEPMAAPAEPKQVAVLAAKHVAEPRPHAARRRAARFTVQVASYLSSPAAERAVHEFALKGVRTRVARVADRAGRKRWFVVRSAEFGSDAEAHRMLYRVRALGCEDAIVLRRLSA